MAELQATIEISVELNRFYNVDLFQRGCYQVQVSLKAPLKSCAYIEISDNKINAQKGSSSEMAAAFKQGAVGKSHKFQIQYRSEEVNIGDVFVFRVHTLVDSIKLEKNLENLDLKLEVQLWSNSEDELTECDAKMELASTRTLLLHLSPTKGLHHYIPVLFDYFHLSAMEVVLHGTVVAIHQPTLNVLKPMKTGKNSDQAALELVYFGQKAATASVSSSAAKSIRMQQAHLMHKTICNILLSAHESLQDCLQQFAALIPGNKFQLACKDCHTRLSEIVKKIQGVVEEDDLIKTAMTDISQLCGENSILWAQFLEIVLKQPQVYLHLAVEHHHHRVHRFAEGFFTLEHNKSSCLSCYDPGIHGHSSLASMVRSSPYFSNLPPLPAECVELDGDENSLPVVFEDVFRDSRALPPHAYLKASHNNSTENSIRNSFKELPSSHQPLSATGGQSTTPRLRKRYSKKLIKNMKPEEMKRPASYFCKDGDASHAGQENTSATPAGVTLIGYRKISAAGSVPSGCLPSSSDLNLKSSLTCGDISSGSRLHPISHTSISRNSSSTSQCATLVQSPRISLKRSPSSDGVSPKSPSHSMTKAPSNNISSSLNKSQSSPSLGDFYSSSQWSSTAGQSTLASMSKFSKEDFSNLVNDICLVLGDKEAVSSTNEDDFSDEDTGVIGGFNEIMSTYKQDFLRAKSGKDQESSQVEDNPASPLVSSAEESSSQEKARDKLHGFDLKSSDSALGSEISSQEEISSSPSPSVAVRILSNTAATTVPVTAAMQVPVTSVPVSSAMQVSAISASSSLSSAATQVPVTIVSTSDSQTSVSLAAPLSSVTQEQAISISTSSAPSSVPSSAPSSTVSTAAQMAPASTKAPRSSHIYSDPEEKLTVLELLKEEYRKSLEERDLQDDDRNHAPSTHGSSIKQTYSNAEFSTFTCHRAASDSDIHLSFDNVLMRNHKTESQETYYSTTDKYEKASLLISSSSSYPDMAQTVRPGPPQLVYGVGQNDNNFIHLRETLKLQMDFPGYLYSEFPVLASSIPYFQVPKDVDELSSGIHLIICVHGLDGNSADLRLVRTFIEMALPGFRLEFLMSERNQQDTFADFDTMTDKLVEEILTFLDTFGLPVARISFVGHSLGNIIIRSTLSRPTMAHLLPKLYTLLSLSGPHLGTLYNTSGLVNMGMWFMQKWKKSASLLQLALKDHSDPRLTFLYRLSQMPVLQYFKHILLVGSQQDRYVPYHSSRIEICRPAQKDTTVTGAVYREMVQNLLEPVIQSPHCTLIRYDVFHALPSTANTMIGRAAHIAVLDSEMFIEKFLIVAGLKYFQ